MPENFSFSRVGWGSSNGGGSCTWPTCELEDLLLLDGVEGTEGSGNSETSLLPDKNSNNWTLANETNKYLER